jgi:carboxyl-terminal processing protease
MVPAVFGLFAAPMLIGFAGTDAFAGHWDRVERSAVRLVSSPAAADDETNALGTYQQALKVLKDEYYPDVVTPPKSRELTYAAIRGMLLTLNDPFTSFLDQDEWNSMQQTTRGDFDGVGAELDEVSGVIVVKRPIPQTPAFYAGIKARDRVVAVGEFRGSKLVHFHPVRGKDINDVVRLIKGPPGTWVALKVARHGAPKEMTFKIRREHIEPPIVQFWMEDEKNAIGHIVLNEFNEKSDEQLDRALRVLRSQGMKALVFDLRYNPGGLLTVAVDVGSRFVKDGPVVILQEKNGQRSDLNARSSQSKITVPTVVLVNENSASASEIVAGAIKDYGAAKIVGEHTFGKGLVQTLFPLGDGSALRLTTAKYFTAKGSDINNRYDELHRPIFGTGGIKPDIVVRQSKDWVEQDFEDKGNDTQLQKALDLLRGELLIARRPR